MPCHCFAGNCAACSCSGVPCGAGCHRAGPNGMVLGLAYANCVNLPAPAAIGGVAPVVPPFNPFGRFGPAIGFLVSILSAAFRPWWVKVATFFCSLVAAPSWWAVTWLLLRQLLSYISFGGIVGYGAVVWLLSSPLQLAGFVVFVSTLALFQYKAKYQGGWYLVSTATVLSLLLYGLHLYLIPPASRHFCSGFDVRGLQAAASDQIKHQFCDSLTVPTDPLATSSFMLPYLDSGKYLRFLLTYGCAVPPVNVALIYGPVNSGKTYGLSMVERFWQIQQGRLVISLDLKGLVEWHDFVHLFRDAVRLETSKFSFSAEEVLSMIKCSSGFNITAPDIEKFLLSPFAEWLVDQGFNDVARYYAEDLAMWTRHLGEFIDSVLMSPFLAFGKPDFRGFLNVMELLTAYRPSLAPIFVIHELERLHLLGQSFFHDIRSTLHEKKQAKSLIPIILETSEYYWALSLANDTLRDKKDRDGTYELFLMPEMVKDEVYATVRGKLTDEEFNLLWENLGGHGGSWQRVWRRHILRNDLSWEQNIELEKESAYRSLFYSIRDADSNASLSSSVRGALSQIVSCPAYVCVYDDPFKHPGVSHLIAANILFAQFRRVYPQYKIMGLAIHAWIIDQNSLSSSDPQATSASERGATAASQKSSNS